MWYKNKIQLNINTIRVFLMDIQYLELEKKNICSIIKAVTDDKRLRPSLKSIFMNLFLQLQC